MPDRSTDIAAFLSAVGWADAGARPLAGDASNRRYLRLTRPDGIRAVLMDAPAERGEDVRPFLRIARHLSALGLSSPAILAEDTRAGLLLLEDLGDALFARVVEAHPEMEVPLYEAAADLLAELHRHAPPKGLACYTPALMADLASLAFDWYRPGATGRDSPARNRFHAETETVLAALPDTDSVLIQRDYHAENLLWLPERDGIARVGLLDFQDAMRGHPAYDLVSVLQDARRDVTPTLAETMVARYIDATGTNAQDFITAYHCLGAQRNLRILGVFARLCLRDGKPHYIDLIPRVWHHLLHDLCHPALSDLADLIQTELPAPTPAILAHLKSRCAA
ncbi:aminoglycoside phosphotransferase family protein [Roseovarius autotrophicus]|uniref:aminoglycoside phosphotransferase family protein n=1 Tax=Roseovarius autotrophicus TaxID=2824121 RepID=UPI001B3696B2|nr:phosphotransferase [Roseovarius autotrophicus]